MKARGTCASNAHHSPQRTYGPVSVLKVSYDVQLTLIISTEIFSHEVLATPLPFFSPVDRNAYYSQPIDGVKKIYGLFPTLLISSNAEGSPQPPPTNAPPPPDPEWAFEIPTSLDTSLKWHPHRALMHRPRCISAEHIECDESESTKVRRWRMKRSYADDMLLRARSMMETSFAFGAELQRLRILGSQADTTRHVDRSSWVAHELLYDINAILDRQTLKLDVLRSFESKEESLYFVQHLENRIACAMGSADVILLQALDACALLGGCELPRWPPQKHWRGAYVHPHLATEGQRPRDEATRLMLGLVRRFERWGVPLWCFAYNKAGFRVDLGVDGRPTRAGKDEQSHQARLAVLKPKIATKEVHYEEVLSFIRHDQTHTNLRPPQSPSIPSGEERTRLEKTILLFLDPARPGHLTFAAFSAMIEEILGGDVWQSARYEERLHRQYYVQTERESWSRIRDGLVDSNHLGLTLSVLEIPPPWYSAHSFALSEHGEGRIAPVPGLEPSRPAVLSPLGMWHVLEVDDFSTETSEDATSLRIQLMQCGVYGWSFTRSFVSSFKDPAGRSIRQSRHVLSLLFKVAAEMSEVVAELQTSRPEQSLQVAHRSTMKLGELGVFDWEKHPSYIDVVYSRCENISARSELLRLAPSFPIPNSGSGDADERSLALKTMTHRMRYSDLFETAKFPPNIDPEARNSLQPRDVSKCSLETLLDLAFAARENDNLEFLDVVRMQRFVSILFCLNEQPDVHFISRVFRSDGPYLKILRYLARMIQQNPQLAGSQYIPRSRRANMTPFYEGIRFSTGGSVEIFLNLDTSEREIPMASQQELDDYEKQLDGLWEMFKKKKSRSEKKRAQRHKAASSVVGSPTKPQ